MKKYISQVTYVIKWLFKWGYFANERDAKEIIRRLEFADELVTKCNLKRFGYMGYLDKLRRSQVDKRHSIVK